MLTILISLLISAVTVATCLLNGLGRGGTITLAILVFFLTIFLIGRRVGKKIAAVQANLQESMQKGQKRISHDIHLFQSKGSGNPKAMQIQVEKKQKQMIRQALEMVEQFTPFKKWNMLMGRQVSTMKLQFHYQLGAYDQVDALLATRNFFSRPMLMEPMLVGMMMARLYSNGDMKALEKTFKKRVRWFRGDRGTLLYGLMSWAYVKKGEPEKALLLLAKAKERTGNEVLARNWEMLANNKTKSFSNKGLGDEWYALGLETPPTPKAQRQRGNAKGR